MRKPNIHDGNIRTFMKILALMLYQPLIKQPSQPYPPSHTGYYSIAISYLFFFLHIDVSQPWTMFGECECFLS